ncbi:MAG: hypothetical protein L6R40_008753 [Gallowayella cf. fulva]|nr:MAG: hypothetical protein L6R40_008753 [Xanthomendoza cf. fulva]
MSYAKLCKFWNKPTMDARGTVNKLVTNTEGKKILVPHRTVVEKNVPTWEYLQDIASKVKVTWHKSTSTNDIKNGYKHHPGYIYISLSPLSFILYLLDTGCCDIEFLLDKDRRVFRINFWQSSNDNFAVCFYVDKEGQVYAAVICLHPNEQHHFPPLLDNSDTISLLKIPGYNIFTCELAQTPDPNHKFGGKDMCGAVLPPWIYEDNTPTSSSSPHATADDVPSFDLASLQRSWILKQHAEKNTLKPIIVAPVPPPPSSSTAGNAQFYVMMPGQNRKRYVSQLEPTIVGGMVDDGLDEEHRVKFPVVTSDNDLHYDQATLSITTEGFLNIENIARGKHIRVTCAEDLKSGKSIQARFPITPNKDGLRSIYMTIPEKEGSSSTKHVLVVQEELHTTCPLYIAFLLSFRH